MNVNRDDQTDLPSGPGLCRHCVIGLLAGGLGWRVGRRTGGLQEVEEAEEGGHTVWVKATLLRLG
jgi:hypothetical protein